MNFEEYLKTIIAWWQHFSYLDDEFLSGIPIPNDISPYYPLLADLEFWATEGLNKPENRISREDKEYAQFINTKLENRTYDENKKVLELCLKMFQNVYFDLAPLPRDKMERYQILIQIPIKERTVDQINELTSLSTAFVLIKDSSQHTN